MFGDVTSANVVGYASNDQVNTVDQNSSLQAYTILGIPFRSIENGGNWSLQDLTLSKMTAYGTSGKADQIWLWVADDKGNWNYEEYYFYKKSGQPNTWVLADGSKTPFDEVHPEGLIPGSAFWYVAYNGDDERSITNSGEVGNADRDIVIARGEYQFVACPFPIQLKLNDATQFDSSECTAYGTSGKSDMIWLWINTGDNKWNYEEYYLYKKSGQPNRWVLADGTKTPFEEVHPNGVPVGSGFWFKSYANDGEDYKITFKTPIPVAK